MSYLLDTNVCVAFLNEKDAMLRGRLRQTPADEVKLCAVVKAELLYGARNGQRAEHNLSRLHRFFEAFESVPFDDAAADQYGVVRAQLRRGGTPVGANDMLIAAIALAGDLTLITRNERELRQIAGLRLDVW